MANLNFLEGTQQRQFFDLSLLVRHCAITFPIAIGVISFGLFCAK